MTRRQAIVEGLAARLAGILTVDGYETDAGAAFYLGVLPVLGEGDPDVAIALLVGDDDPKYVGANVRIGLPVRVAAVAKVDLDAPWSQLEAVLGDIKRAVEQPDRTLGGLVEPRLERGPTRTLPRHDGSTTVGLSIEYRASYVEAWGAP